MKQLGKAYANTIFQPGLRPALKTRQVKAMPVVRKKMKNPYTISGAPKMIRSFVCYADILGYSHLSGEAISSGRGNEFLSRLHSALKSAYDRIRERSKDWQGDPYYAVKVFTDNIVVGYPLMRPSFDYGEPELGDIMGAFNELQVALAMEGFFLRGGIALGELFMDDDIVFGDALLQAVNLDKNGGPPRLSLAPSAVEIVRRQLGFYGEDRTWAPHYEYLLEDADGAIFLNYLYEAFFAFPDGGIFFEVIEKHKESVVKNLQDYKASPALRAKYEWAARYHNFVCKDFVERHPVPWHEDSDEEYAAATEQAQGLLDHIIDIESMTTTPARINLEPIKLERN